jgi:hypothetical protein
MLTADQLIDAYAADVARLLPSKQRADVAAELRALLHDEIDAAAPDPADRDKVARDYLVKFGRPVEVAARYGTPVALIDPLDTRWFARLSVIGSAFLLLAGLLGVLSRQNGDWRATSDAVRDWWPTAWPGVFTFLGVLLVIFALIAWKRRRWPSPTTWKPHALPTDRISRTGRTAALVFYIAGTIALLRPDWFFRFPKVHEVFAYDESFLRLRGPVLLAVVVLSIVFQAMLVVDGKWRPWTRVAEAVMGAATCAVLVWAIAAPIFQAIPTDQTMRDTIALIVLASFVDLAVRAWRRVV